MVDRPPAAARPSRGTGSGSLGFGHGRPELPVQEEEARQVAADVAGAVVAAKERPKAAALHQCGLARLKMGDVRGAYEDFREAARIEPQNMEIWCRYEETYRAVEPQIAEELARAPPPVELPLGRFGAGRPTQQPDGPLRHFSLKAPEGPSAAAEADLEAGERAAALQARLFRGMPSVGAGGEGFGGGAESPCRGRAATGARRSTSTESRRSRRGSVHYIELTCGNNRTYMITQGAWLVTWMMVIYHYRFQKRHSQRMTTSETLVGSLMMISMVWLVWGLNTRSRPITLSLSDAMKVICGFIILSCAVYHYYKDIRNA